LQNALAHIEVEIQKVIGPLPAAAAVSLALHNGGMKKTEGKEQHLVLGWLGALRKVCDRKFGIVLTLDSAHAIVLLQPDLDASLQNADGKCLVALAAKPQAKTFGPVGAQAGC